MFQTCHRNFPRFPKAAADESKQWRACGASPARARPRAARRQCRAGQPVSHGPRLLSAATRAHLSGSRRSPLLPAGLRPRRSLPVSADVSSSQAFSAQKQAAPKAAHLQAGLLECTDLQGNIVSQQHVRAASRESFSSAHQHS